VGINIEKAWNLFLLILRLEVLEKPYTQEQTMNAHADMLIVVGYNGFNTPRGIYRSLVSGVRNFPVF
jgi:hypothetical protein